MATRNPNLKLATAAFACYAIGLLAIISYSGKNSPYMYDPYGPRYIYDSPSAAMCIDAEQRYGVRHLSYTSPTSTIHLSAPILMVLNQGWTGEFILYNKWRFSNCVIDDNYFKENKIHRLILNAESERIRNESETIFWILIIIGASADPINLTLLLTSLYFLKPVQQLNKVRLLIHNRQMAKSGLRIDVERFRLENGRLLCELKVTNTSPFTIKDPIFKVAQVGKSGSIVTKPHKQTFYTTISQNETITLNNFDLGKGDQQTHTITCKATKAPITHAQQHV